ncbi:hypothetical protein SAMN05216262_101439 [Colwellia chukchiensis]|uniref:Prepilin-type N-terminal cleavage/methylation domain-containing protein n=1 Tax=Colwellia chukchiensis TaxID=641665 RepID=A0A1H7H9Y4_9GAMM|nr:hypothetical protein [Colwellia chukchiensis]SEK47206.1 hypothetical protein SAMN05216262_101439 [Colwellia chukchiensis]
MLISQFKIVAARGLTLIELLVVISIMMTMIALVAPLTIDTVNKAQAQSEYLSLTATIRRASVEAFINGAGVDIELNKDQLKAFRIKPSFTTSMQTSATNKQLILQKQYQYLSFNDDIIKLNKNGIANISDFELKQGNLTKTINILALLEN